MPEADRPGEAPATARYYREAVEQIVQCVDEGTYCALLGPRLSGKTLLLRFIEQNLARTYGWTCAYLDLLTLRSSTQQAFFEDLIQLTARRLAELTGYDLPLPLEGDASSAVFRGFLADCLDILNRDLVLIIDPLEALPTDLVQALLTSLRAAYMDQQDMDNQAIVIVSGALSLANLTVGESSPFRGIARRVFIGDLSESDSQALLGEFLSEHQISATPVANQRLLRATSGDTYLMRRISQRCAELARNRKTYRLNARDVALVTNRFLRDDVFQYAPLLEAIRLIEDDPDLVQCILRLLEYEAVPRVELPLPLSPDLDPLFLTGVVERVEGDRYRLQNLIYRRFLTNHFIPGRVGHVLTMAGRWDAAIDYLEMGISQGDEQSRLDLLQAAINSMYASQDLNQAGHFMRRGLSAAFGLPRTQIWYAPPSENMLRPVGVGGSSGGNGFPYTPIPTNADLLEARAYRQQIPLRGQEVDQQAVRAIPLKIPGRTPIGVVTIYDDPGSERFIQQRDRELQMVGFLNQAARALQVVSLRRQELALAGRLQASLLPEEPPIVPGWELSASWRPARETAGDFYDYIDLPDGKIAVVIADVVDKGMGAALLMALSRTLLRTYATDFPSEPERVLHIANQRLLGDVDAGMFVTAFYGVLDPDSGMLTYCNAGHHPPYLLRPGNPPGEEILPRTGMALGIDPGASWSTNTIQIPPGALLLLYTDGIVEAQNSKGEFFGTDLMLNSIRHLLGRPAAQIDLTLLAAIDSFAAGAPQSDDIALIVVTRATVPPATSISESPR